MRTISQVFMPCTSCSATVSSARATFLLGNDYWASLKVSEARWANFWASFAVHYSSVRPVVPAQASSFSRVAEDFVSAREGASISWIAAAVDAKRTNFFIIIRIFW